MSNQKYLYLAKKAISLYDIAYTELEFIRHNENLIYKVIGNDSDYVLRIHKSSGNVYITNRSTELSLSSELKFINAISNNTDVCVQTPIPTKNGNWVGKLYDDEGNEVLCTLLSWVSGEIMRSKNIQAEKYAYKAGQMVAKLHNFEENWIPESPFARPTYDNSFHKDMCSKIKDAITQRLMTEEQYLLILETADKISDMMTELDRRGNAKGIIHSDIQSSNIIVHDDELALIDFGFAGYGYYLFDVGLLMGSFNSKEAREQMLAGYRSIRNLPEADMKYVEAFFLQSIFFCMSMHATNPHMAEWFVRRAQPICDEYIKPFLADERFYKDI